MLWSKREIYHKKKKLSLDLEGFNSMIMYPGIEGKNFYLLCLIDYSITAIHVFPFIWGGRGVQLEMDSFSCHMTKQQS